MEHVCNSTARLAWARGPVVVTSKPKDPSSSSHAMALAEPMASAACNFFLFRVSTSEEASNRRRRSEENEVAAAVMPRGPTAKITKEIYKKMNKIKTLNFWRNTDFLKSQKIRKSQKVARAHTPTTYLALSPVVPGVVPRCPWRCLNISFNKHFHFLNFWTFHWHFYIFDSRRENNISFFLICWLKFYIFLSFTFFKLI